MIRVILAFFILFLSGCATTSFNSEVKKSWYINRDLATFEVNNGFCYAREKSSDGGYLNYWKSGSVRDLFGEGSDDSLECRLMLKTNKNNIVKEIKIIDYSFACATVLR